MKALLKKHKDFIANITTRKDAFDLKKLLITYFFNHEKQQAMIVQHINRLVVFYMTSDIYTHEEDKNEKIEAFWELIVLLQFLRDQHYIYPVLSQSSEEKITVYSDLFDSPKIEPQRIVLNTAGDFTSQPEIISNMHGITIYQGIVYREKYAQSIINNISGLYKTGTHISSLQSINSASSTKKQHQPKEKQKKKDVAIHNSSSSKKEGHLSHKPRRQRSLIPLIISALAFLFLIAFNIYQTILIQKIGTPVNTDNHKNIKTQTLELSSTSSSIVYGIDVSRYNKDIVKYLPDSIQFVICKATEGIDYVDPYFYFNWQLLTEKNMIKGAYHFYVTDDDPLQQAMHFIATIKDVYGNALAPIVDIEQLGLSKTEQLTPQKLQQELLIFLEHIAKTMKRTPMIYGNTSFLNQYLNDTIFQKFPLWIADYTQEQSPSIPKVWQKKGFKIWQKTDRFFIHNLDCSLDIFFGKKEDLLNF